MKEQTWVKGLLLGLRSLHHHGRNGSPQDCRGRRGISVVLPDPQVSSHPCTAPTNQKNPEDRPTGRGTTPYTRPPTRTSDTVGVPLFSPDSCGRTNRHLRDRSGVTTAGPYRSISGVVGEGREPWSWSGRTEGVTHVSESQGRQEFLHTFHTLLVFPSGPRRLSK